MLVIEIDDVDAQALQACLAGLLHIFWSAIHLAATASSAQVAKFRGEEDLPTSRSQRVGEEQFAGSIAVRVCRVEEIDSEVKRTIERRTCFRVIGIFRLEAQTETTETDCRNARAVAPELPGFHRRELLRLML